MATKKSRTIAATNVKKPLATKKTAALTSVKAVKAVSKETPGTTRKKRVAKAVPSKIGSRLTLDPKPPVRDLVIAHDEVALRAYFIAERRHKMGWPGDSSTDWSDAVKQLRAEALEKPLKKR